MALTDAFRSKARRLADELIEEMCKTPPGVSAPPGFGTRDDRKIVDLISGGAKLTVHDANGWTLLQRAAFFGVAAAIRPLLDRGADLHQRDNTRNGGGRNLLMLSVQKGHAAAASALLKAGIDPDETDDYGQTALHACIWHGETMKMLIAAGGAIDPRDKNGFTPLMSAAYGSETPDAAMALIAAGASLDAADDKGRNALALARENPRPRPEKMQAAIEQAYADDARRKAEAEAQRRRDIEEISRTAPVAQADIVVKKPPAFRTPS